MARRRENRGAPLGSAGALVGAPGRASRVCGHGPAEPMRGVGSAKRGKCGCLAALRKTPPMDSQPNSHGPSRRPRHRHNSHGVAAAHDVGNVMRIAPTRGIGRSGDRRGPGAPDRNLGIGVGPLSLSAPSIPAVDPCGRSGDRSRVTALHKSNSPFSTKSLKVWLPHLDDLMDVVRGILLNTFRDITVKSSTHTHTHKHHACRNTRPTHEHTYDGHGYHQGPTRADPRSIWG